MPVPFASLLLKRFCCLCFLVLFTFAIQAQTQKAPADFLPFLAGRAGKDTRINKLILKVRLSEVYYNDSLGRVINELDQTRLLAATGFYGAGPLLKKDFSLTSADFKLIKAVVTKPYKTQWDSTDFKGFTVSRHSMSSFDYYSYSLPIYLKDKKLILIKKQYNGGTSNNTWNCWDVYRILKPGQYKFIRSYLRKDEGLRNASIPVQEEGE